MYVSKRQQTCGVAGIMMFNIGVKFIDSDKCDYIKVVFTFLKIIIGKDIMLCV